MLKVSRVTYNSTRSTITESASANNGALQEVVTLLDGLSLPETLVVAIAIGEEE